MTGSAAPAPRPLRGGLAIAFALFVATLILHTRHNDFAYYYHFDEPTKIEQVLTGERNFNHPQLMLNTTALVVKVANVPREPQRIVEVGRWVSATFSAIAVAAFALLAHLYAGPLAAVCAGVLVGMHPMAFELSHFFKEDPALLMGLALGFLAMRLHQDAPGRGRAAFLGLAAAIALSGKYVGIAALAGAIIVLARVPQGRRANAGVFAAAFIATLLVVNFQTITSAASFGGGVDANVSDFSRASKWKDVPQWERMAGLYAEYLEWPVALFALVFAARQAARWKQRDPAGWVLLLYPVVYSLVLVFSPRLFSRHFLPIAAAFHAMAGIGMASLAALPLPWKFRWEAAARTVAVLLVLFLTVRAGERRALMKRYDPFANPSRERLAAWVRANIPEEAVIAEDLFVYLLDPEGRPRPEFALKHSIVASKQLSDFGSLEKLRRMGVSHVIAHQDASVRLMEKVAGKAPPGSLLEADPAARAFYAELATLPLVLDQRRGSSGYLTPGFKVYRIAPAARRPEQEPAEKRRETR